MQPFMDQGYATYVRKRGKPTLLGLHSKVGKHLEEEESSNIGDGDSTLRILNDLAQG